MDFFPEFVRQMIRDRLAAFRSIHTSLSVAERNRCKSCSYIKPLKLGS